MLILHNFGDETATRVPCYPFGASDPDVTCVKLLTNLI